MKINAKIAISKMVWTLSAGLRLANFIHGDKQVTKINLLKFSYSFPVIICYGFKNVVYGKIFVNHTSYLVEHKLGNIHF